MHKHDNSGEAVSPIAMKVIIGFLLVLSIALAIWAGFSHIRMNRYHIALQSAYQRAADTAADSLSNLSSDLVKGMYAGTSPQLSLISSQLWKESAAAKSALSTLPVTGTVMANTNRFLSQTGDYAMYLSRKFASGQELTDEERSHLVSLREYADRLSGQLDQIATSLQNGTISVANLSTNEAAQLSNEENAALPEDTSPTKQMEDGFMGYPTLIYDGPFSDHLLDKDPLMTKGKSEISLDKARAVAAKASNKNLPEYREEDSHLPCYVFHDGVSNSVAVTKNGGYLCYLISERPENITSNLNYTDAVPKAQKFLADNGYSSMKDTYYETDNGVMTINFAYQDPTTQTICYTDLIKVDISLQDGSVLGMDARGYLVNHTDRDFKTPSITEEEARKSLNPALTVENTRTAIIPTAGKNEASVYEFLCSSETGDKVLSYINIDTAAEEQLLILLETPNGTLTK